MWHRVGTRYLPIYLSSKLSALLSCHGISETIQREKGARFCLLPFCRCQRKRSPSRHLLPRENQPGTSPVTLRGDGTAAPLVCLRSSSRAPEFLAVVLCIARRIIRIILAHNGFSSLFFSLSLIFFPVRRLRRNHESRLH